MGARDEGASSNRLWVHGMIGRAAPRRLGPLPAPGGQDTTEQAPLPTPGGHDTTEQAGSFPNSGSRGGTRKRDDADVVENQQHDDKGEERKYLAAVPDNTNPMSTTRRLLDSDTQHVVSAAPFKLDPGPTWGRPPGPEVFLGVPEAMANDDGFFQLPELRWPRKIANRPTFLIAVEFWGHVYHGWADLFAPLYVTKYHLYGKEAQINVVVVYMSVSVGVGFHVFLVIRIEKLFGSRIS